MSAIFAFGEDNGTATGPASAVKGTTRTTGVTNVNWKNTDDVATAYTSSPISAGNNSYTKYQFGVFTGTFNQIQNVKWNHTSGTLGAGLTLKAATTTGYATPAATANASLVNNVTLTGGIATGFTITLSTAGPEQAGAATLAAPGFTQYMATQLQTTVAAAAGDTATVVLTLRYDEN